ncbi:MAG TPA: ATP-binding protein, partial [Dokdonella sp.]
VTRKLLNFSRQDETRVECFDAGDALRELAPMLRQALDPGVRLEFDLADEPLPIEFDRAQFDLIALNLASNANHAMPQGGRLSLAARRDGDGVALAFADDGIGMSDEVRARAFEPFFSTKPAGQGVGLGLSVTHDLVVAAGGRIEVQSAPGHTTFRIRLPIAHGAMANA